MAAVAVPGFRLGPTIISATSSLKILVLSLAAGGAMGAMVVSMEAMAALAAKALRLGRTEVLATLTWKIPVLSRAAMAAMAAIPTAAATAATAAMGVTVLLLVLTTGVSA